jgi:hypothetical protein
MDFHRLIRKKGEKVVFHLLLRMNLITFPCLFLGFQNKRMEKNINQKWIHVMCAYHNFYYL